MVWLMCVVRGLSFLGDLQLPLVAGFYFVAVFCGRSEQRLDTATTL